ncbi:MAG: hypothetical protein ACPGQD_08130 [Planctomycetota bacterium]
MSPYEFLGIAMARFAGTPMGIEHDLARQQAKAMYRMYLEVCKELEEEGY